MIEEAGDFSNRDDCVVGENDAAEMSLTKLLGVVNAFVLHRSREIRKGKDMVLTAYILCGI